MLTSGGYQVINVVDFHRKELFVTLQIYMEKVLYKLVDFKCDQYGSFPYIYIYL